MPDAAALEAWLGIQKQLRRRARLPFVRSFVHSLVRMKLQHGELYARVRQAKTFIGGLSGMIVYIRMVQKSVCSKQLI